MTDDRIHYIQPIHIDIQSIRRKIDNNLPLPRRSPPCKKTTTPHSLVDRGNAPHRAAHSERRGDAEMPTHPPSDADTKITHAIPGATTFEEYALQGGGGRPKTY